MSDDLSIFSSPGLKNVVQDMRDLLSHSQLAFLMGAGCSKIAGLPLMPELTEKVLTHEKISKSTKELLDKICEFFSGTKTATIEDYLSEIVDFLSIAERRSRCGAMQCKIAVGDQERDALQLKDSLDEIKRVISSIIGDNEVNISVHQKFVRAIHGSLQAGKNSRSVDYFVLNYDTLVEDALGLERVVYCDGFIGAPTGWWEPNIFKADKMGARVFKVHGSIDWCLLKDDSLPRRIRSGIKTHTDMKHVLIYPAATKYQETQRDPFLQLLHFMRQSLCFDGGKEMVLAICGYNFGDSHIDLELENALYQSEGRLTIAAFVGSDEPTGKLRSWLNDATVSRQIRVYANRGFFHGDEISNQDKELPWWKFENLARLLGGER